MMDLCNEVRSAFSEEKDITSTQCIRLKYLNAVIEESLRLYPPLVTNLPRLVRQDGDVVDGYVVPAGVNYVILLFLTQAR